MDASDKVERKSLWANGKLVKWLTESSKEHE
jgi:hypothetical protein